MKKNLLKLAMRLKEPSTYAGLSAIALIYGASAAEFEGWVAAVSGGCAFLAIVLGEVGSDA